MVTEKPEWFDKWVIAEPDNWHLKKDAPEKVKQEYEKFMAEDEE